MHFLTVFELKHRKVDFAVPEVFIGICRRIVTVDSHVKLTSGISQVRIARRNAVGKHLAVGITFAVYVCRRIAPRRVLADSSHSGLNTFRGQFAGSFDYGIHITADVAHPASGPLLAFFEEVYVLPALIRTMHDDLLGIFRTRHLYFFCIGTNECRRCRLVGQRAVDNFGSYSRRKAVSSRIDAIDHRCILRSAEHAAHALPVEPHFAVAVLYRRACRSHLAGYTAEFRAFDIY